VIVGILGSVAVTRLLSGFLFGIKPTDPMTFLAVPLLLASIALLASYVPARAPRKSIRWPRCAVNSESRSKY
jgi:hypothetical protein